MTISNTQHDLLPTTTLVTPARSSTTTEPQFLLTTNENDLLRDIEKIAQLFYPSETVPGTIRASYLAAKQFGSDVYNIQRAAAWGDNFKFHSNVLTRDQQAVSALGSCLKFCQTRF
jgi:hypothetical protein